MRMYFYFYLFQTDNEIISKFSVVNAKCCLRRVIINVFIKYIVFISVAEDLMYLYIFFAKFCVHIVKLISMSNIFI